MEEGNEERMEKYGSREKRDKRYTNKKNGVGK